MIALVPFVSLTRLSSRSLDHDEHNEPTLIEFHAQQICQGTPEMSIKPQTALILIFQIKKENDKMTCKGIRD